LRRELETDVNPRTPEDRGRLEGYVSYSERATQLRATAMGKKVMPSRIIVISKGLPSISSLKWTLICKHGEVKWQWGWRWLDPLPAPISISASNHITNANCAELV